MSEQKTKPGPWEVRHLGDDWYKVMRTVPHTVDHRMKGLDLAHQQRDELNSQERIRDAAPALLALCEESLAAFEAMGLMGTELQPKLRKLIRKVRGADQ